MKDAWKGFKGGYYETAIDVRDFIQTNYTPYEGDKSFLKGATARTNALMKDVNELLKRERDNGGVLDVDTERVSGLTEYPAGYINKDLELILGLQTDEPLKRGLNPFGGMRMARSACQA